MAPLFCFRLAKVILTHWGRVTHICVVKLTIIGSDNGLSPGRRQAIIWTNAGILLIGPLGTNFSEILIEIYTFSFKKMHLKMSSAKWRLFGLGLNELRLGHWYNIPLKVPNATNRSLPKPNAIFTKSWSSGTGEKLQVQIRIYAPISCAVFTFRTRALCTGTLGFVNAFLCGVWDVE